MRATTRPRGPVESSQQHLTCRVLPGVGSRELVGKAGPLWSDRDYRWRRQPENPCEIGRCVPGSPRPTLGADCRAQAGSCPVRRTAVAVEVLGDRPAALCLADRARLRRRLFPSGFIAMHSV